MSINRVVISGNLTRDPELRSTAGGMAVLGFGMAVNDRRRNAQTGEWEDYPNFIDCTMFGSRAEALQRYLSKGTKVCVEGKLRWSQWERDGQKRSKIEVIVDTLDFMSSRNGGGAQSQGGYAPAQNDNRGANQGGYAPAPQQSYVPQQGAPQQGYSPQQSYAPQQGYAQPADASQAYDASSSVYDEEIPF